MKIAIISDSHDAWQELTTAISIAHEMGCEALLHAGDFVTPSGIPLLADFNGTVHMVWGNNEGEKEGFLKQIARFANLTHHGNVMEQTFGNLRFFMNHYPTHAEHAAASGKYDVCIYGHDHRYRDETLPNGTRLLNSGELVGTKTGVSTMLIFDTDTKHAEKITVATNRFRLP